MGRKFSGGEKAYWCQESFPSGFNQLGCRFLDPELGAVAGGGKQLVTSCVKCVGPGSYRDFP